MEKSFICRWSTHVFTHERWELAIVRLPWGKPPERSFVLCCSPSIIALGRHPEVTRLVGRRKRSWLGSNVGQCYSISRAEWGWMPKIRILDPWVIWWPQIHSSTWLSKVPNQFKGSSKLGFRRESHVFKMVELTTCFPHYKGHFGLIPGISPWLQKPPNVHHLPRSYWGSAESCSPTILGCVIIWQKYQPVPNGV